MQQGFWDNSILCKECDNHIGKYDTYAKAFLNRNYLSQIKVGQSSTNKQCSYIKINNFNYNKLKLFFISILWRASISTLSTYSKIDLEEHEALAKDMIKNNDVKDESVFQTVLTFIKPSKDGNDFEKVVFSPVKRSFGEASCYSFMMAGFEITINASKKSSTMHLPGLNMHPNGFIMLVNEFEKSLMGRCIPDLRQKLSKNRL